MEFIWIRIGDGGEYERHDSLDEAVAEIHATVCNDHRDRDASELPCPDGHAVTDMRQSKVLNGIGVDSYVAYNGISLYHGDAESEFIAPISDDEYEIVRALIGGQLMEIIAYAYDADHHCVACTVKRHESNEFDGLELAYKYTPESRPDENGIPYFAFLDVVLGTDEWQELDEGYLDENPTQYLACGDCHEVIREYTHPVRLEDGEWQGLR